MQKRESTLGARNWKKREIGTGLGLEREWICMYEEWASRMRDRDGICSEKCR